MHNTFTKTFESNPELLPDIEFFVLEIVDKLKVSQGIRDNIEMAVAEAAANSILHGNKSDLSKNVEVKISISSEQIKITFKDEGNGFKVENVPDPTIPENILKGSGRGVHIMKSLVDDLTYNFTDTGTELTMSFNL